jgi:hypothetical protein
MHVASHESSEKERGAKSEGGKNKGRKTRGRRLEGLEREEALPLMSSKPSNLHPLDPDT